MSKTKISLFVVSSALLAITIFIVSRHLRPGGGYHQAAATSRQIATGTTSIASDPISDRTSFKTRNRNSAEEGERQRLVTENRKLVDELSRTKAAWRFQSYLASKLASPELIQIPETDAEAAVLVGQFHRAGLDFVAKWGGTEPSEDSSEFKQYTDELDAIASDFVAATKSIETFWQGDLAKSSSRIAQFQSLLMYGALELEGSNWEAIDGMMARYYEDGFSRGLNGANKPETGLDEWQARRVAASQQAFDEIQKTLPGEKRDDFQHLYDRDDFLWSFNFGGFENRRAEPQR